MHGNVGYCLSALAEVKIMEPSFQKIKTSFEKI